MEAVSDVVIDGGRLAGTADVSVTDFGFQTTRLGRVENVNGQVHFADLFTLSTDPDTGADRWRNGSWRSAS